MISHVLLADSASGWPLAGKYSFVTLPRIEPGPLNHIALATVDPERSAQFYCEVLGFRIVPRPSFSFDGRWLYREEVGPMIHLIHDAKHETPAGEINTRGNHFAMQCRQMDRAIDELRAREIEYAVRVLPDHGYRQIFFRDPDGHVVELGEWPDIHDMVMDDDTESSESADGP